MKKSVYRPQYRRRRAGVTHYRKRLKMLLSKKPRFVVRESLKHISIQITGYSTNGDVILTSAFSGELKKYGWKYEGSNVPTAYLTGMLIATRAKGKVAEAVLDMGMRTPTNGSKMYAAVKGAIDAGLRIPCSMEAMPSEERIKGIHIAAFASKLKKENPELYKKQFSLYIKNNIDIEKMPNDFEEMRKRVVQQDTAKVKT